MIVFSIGLIYEIWSTSIAVHYCAIKSFGEWEVGEKWGKGELCHNHLFSTDVHVPEKRRSFKTCSVLRKYRPSECGIKISSPYIRHSREILLQYFQKIMRGSKSYNQICVTHLIAQKSFLQKPLSWYFCNPISYNGTLSNLKRKWKPNRASYFGMSLLIIELILYIRTSDEK